MTDEEMAALTVDAKTVSDRIRILHRAGLKKAEISRFLDIQYQHVYNVLDRDKRKGERSPPKASASPRTFVLRLNEKGQLSIPDEYLSAEGLREGDFLVCRRDAEGIRIMTRTAAVEHLRKITRQRMPDEAALLDILLAPQSG